MSSTVLDVWIPPHCGCWPHVVYGVEGLGASGASVLSPTAFVLVRPLVQWSTDRTAEYSDQSVVNVPQQLDISNQQVEVTISPSLPSRPIYLQQSDGIAICCRYSSGSLFSLYRDV